MNGTGHFYANYVGVFKLPETGTVLHEEILKILVFLQMFQKIMNLKKRRNVFWIFRRDPTFVFCLSIMEMKRAAVKVILF